MKTGYVLTAGLLALLVCGLAFYAGTRNGDRYKMLPTTTAAGSSLYLLDGRTGKTWQLVTVEDDPTGSADFWSPIDKLDTREAAAKRLEDLSAEGAEGSKPEEPISFPQAPRRAGGGPPPSL